MIEVLRDEFIDSRKEDFAEDFKCIPVTAKEAKEE